MEYIMRLKTASLLLGFVFSLQAFASNNPNDNLSAEDLKQKVQFKYIVTTSLKKYDLLTFRAELVRANNKVWCGKKGLDWALYIALQEKCDTAIEPIFSAASGQNILLDDDTIKGFYNTASTQKQQFELLDACLRNNQGLGLLQAVDKDEILRKASAQGCIALVHSMFNQPKEIYDLKPELRLYVAKTAASNGQLAVLQYVIQDTQDKKQLDKKFVNDVFSSSTTLYSAYTSNPMIQDKIKLVIRYLLDLGENGPDQEHVDRLFSLNIYGQRALLETLLLDDSTKKLRKGLRPSNQKIRELKESPYLEEDRKFLNDLIE